MANSPHHSSTSWITPIHHIFAADEDGGIGLETGGLPWDIPTDWEHFLNICAPIENRSTSTYILFGHITKMVQYGEGCKFGPKPTMSPIRNVNNALHIFQ